MEGIAIVISVHLEPACIRGSASMQLVDLTHHIEEGMPTFHAPWHPPVEIEQLGTISDEGRETRKLSLGTHTGTHMDAPLHFLSDGASIEDLDLAALVGPVTIVDFSHLDENEAVTRPMLESVDLSDRLIARFGWADQWRDADAFYYDYPYFTTGAASYLVDSGLELLGLDTPSPDSSQGSLDGGDDDSPVHKIFLEAEVVLLEYLANLDTLADLEGWTLAALPMKVRGADGAPARAVLWRE